MKNVYLFALITVGILLSCNQKPETSPVAIEDDLVFEKEKSIAHQIAALNEAGFQIFDYVDDETGDTTIMQEYFMAFLKRGPNRSQSKEERDSPSSFTYGTPR